MITAVLSLAMVMLREALAANRGAVSPDRDTSTLRSTVIAERPSVTEISRLSSLAEEPSWRYCSTFSSISSYVNVSPFKNKTNYRTNYFWE